MNKVEQEDSPRETQNHDLRLGSEARGMIGKAEQLAKSVLFQMSLNQLNDFKEYFRKVTDDYYEKYSRWRDKRSGEEVDTPVYRKLPGYEGADWWALAETLFDEDGGQSMSGLVVMFVEKFLPEALSEKK